MWGSRRAAAVVGLLLSVALVACSGDDGEGTAGGDGPERNTVRVAAVPVADIAPLYIAKERGYFEDEGLDVRIEPIQQSTLAIPGLLKGDVDVIAGGNYVTFFQAYSKGTANIRVIAEGSRSSPGYLGTVVMPTSPVRGVKDLTGRRVAVNVLNNIQSLTLDAVTRAQGGDPAKTRYVQIPFANVAAALERGQVDAASLPEPFLSDVKSTLGARVIADQGTGQVADFPLSGYLSVDRFVNENPRTIDAFRRALRKAQSVAASDRKAVEQVLPSYTKITPEVAARIALATYPTELDAVRLQQVALMMMNQGMVTEPLDIGPMLVLG
jgi:NitT/TauT family transport system substrate-binding protein